MTSPKLGPLVSICIPAFNRPDDLIEAIESVLRQEYENVEVVVSDDSGSCKGVVAALRDPRVRYFANPRRLGLAGNWTEAMRKAKGDLMGLLMDDDRLLPGFLASVVDRFMADPGLGVVFTNHFFEDRAHTWTRTCKLAGGRYDNFLPFLLIYNPVPVSAAIMRRKVWADLPPLPDIQTADLFMFLKAAEAGWSFYYVDRPLMVYKLHPDQLSAQKSFRPETIRVLEEFSFSDSRDERLRVELLSQAIVGRSVDALKHGESSAAREDIARAWRLLPEVVFGRAAFVWLLTWFPRLVPLVDVIYSVSIGPSRGAKRMSGGCHLSAPRKPTGVNRKGEYCADRKTEIGNVLNRDGRPAVLVYGATQNLQLLEFIGTVPGRVLDVGCGKGAWAESLRESGAEEIIGIDASGEATATAQGRYDLAIHGDIEQVSLDDTGGERFDLIVVADVLEHLSDPWTVLAKLRSWIKPGGHLLASVPNLRNFRLLSTLVIRGNFEYSDVGGLMDRGHVRWFTGRSLEASLRSGGWKPIRWGGSIGRLRKSLNWATGGVLGGFLWDQIFVLAEPD